MTVSDVMKRSAELQMKQAIERLRAGEVVALPTETVYGLAARISCAEAIEKIFRLKKRPFFDPLIVHGCDRKMLAPVVASFPHWAEVLAEAFWPGPLTLVLPKVSSLNAMITSGLETVAVRIPKHVVTLEVLRHVGEAVAAPSANLFGRTSPTQADHVRTEFGEALFVLEGGPCETGIESTVVDMQEEQQMLTILRPGLIDERGLSDVLRVHYPRLSIQFQTSGASPGHLKAHYQPRVPLTLYRSGHKPPVSSHVSSKSIGHLILNDDPRLAARHLYAEMRRLCEEQIEEIHCEWRFDEDDPDWRAIWDRLSRAATVLLL